jgi:RNA polymerase sigma factor (TIGR02999 family)
MNSDVTRILNSIDAGDASKSEDLIPYVYQELRVLAASRMAQERAGQTLQATALVHEAYLRLTGGDEGGQQWNSRGHFFAAAAEAMRRILIDRARQKKAVKHGGDLVRVDLEDIDQAINADDDRLLQIDEAIQRLAENDKQAADLIKLRFFAGMTNLEAAQSLGLAERTANRIWAYSRAWLLAELTSDSSDA